MSAKGIKRSFKRHPAAIALDRWLDEHPQTTDPRGLGASKEMEGFLVNRLARAFQAGWDAGQVARDADFQTRFQQLFLTPD